MTLPKTERIPITQWYTKQENGQKLARCFRKEDTQIDRSKMVAEEVEVTLTSSQGQTENTTKIWKNQPE